MQATVTREPAAIPPTVETLAALREAGEDFEWYPTTDEMVRVVARAIRGGEFDWRCGSILDIGAGDGRVLVKLADYITAGNERASRPELFGIEKSRVLVQAQPDEITPLGTDLFEQNLACLPVGYIFCNPPYSQYESWAITIIEGGYARKAFLVIPQRWADNKAIADAIRRRGAAARVLFTGDFLNAERQARAVVNIVEVSYPRADGRWHDSGVKDPFDQWFDQNITTFDPADDEVKDDAPDSDLAKLRGLDTVAELVEAYNEEYARMEANYKAIFKLDYQLLKELGVSKESVRDGIKRKMVNLKTKYWRALFERLDTITNRLATATKEQFLRKITSCTVVHSSDDRRRDTAVSVAFTANNAYAVVLWAIKHANKYYDEQLIALFRELSCKENVTNYKSNLKTWVDNGWRYNHYSSDEDKPSHYALDYRIVAPGYHGIETDTWRGRNGLTEAGHNLIADIIAVLYNLGFQTGLPRSHSRQWAAGKPQEFYTPDYGETLFEARAFKNGNMHLRFKPEAIKALNVEAGRLLGWLRSAADVVRELGYTSDEAQRYFGCSWQLSASKIPLLSSNAV